MPRLRLRTPTLRVGMGRVVPVEVYKEMAAREGWQINLVTAHLEQCNLVSSPCLLAAHKLAAGCCWLDSYQHSMLPLLASCSCLSRFAVPVALGSFTVIRYPCQYFNEI